MTQLRIGISGWTYEPWRGVFYPKGLVQKRELEYASRALNSIEINGTFYSLQSPESYRKWSAEVPDDFIFAVKGSKYITHRKRLQDIRIPLANFFGSGLLLLGKKLGPILWQFPPWDRFDAKRLSDFLKLLPKTTKAAAKLAAENTIKDPEKAWSEAVNAQPLRYAFEPRHESFFVPEFIDLLRKHNAALTFADSAGKWPYAEDITSDLVYIRLHGKDKIYDSDYSEDELDAWAQKIDLWRQGKEPKCGTRIGAAKPKTLKARDIYVFFDNSIKVHAPFDAMQLGEKLGIKNKTPAV